MSIRAILAVMLLVGMCCLPFLVSRWLDKANAHQNASGRASSTSSQTATKIPDGRSEVLFWHFWGGRDRDIVNDVARRFNQSQDKYFVRAIAMPGNNLQAKLFLSVAGGDPPDLVNQDDPILADWAERGIIHRMNEIADPAEVEKVRAWMFDSAVRLSTFNDQMCGVCNGLDIRALYYNKSVLDSHQLQPPKTIDDLNQIAETISPASTELKERYAYLPDSRRLWAWAYVFGGDFYDAKSERVTLNSKPNVDALEWMQLFSKSYGEDNLIAFRQGDQSLPGKTFPLLPVESDQIQGRYTLIMDGQWRVRDIRAFQTKRREAGLVVPEFGVCPLPAPKEGREQSGWVNGNFFVVPRGAKNGEGAWEFIKFWIGFTDSTQAAKTCADGGWIPVSQSVVDDETFQSYLDTSPLFNRFVELASSPNQFPVPQVQGAAMFRRSVESAAYEAMTTPGSDPGVILKDTRQRIQTHLDRVRR